jgi:hypothetical protein
MPEFDLARLWSDRSDGRDTALRDGLLPLVGACARLLGQLLLGDLRYVRRRRAAAREIHSMLIGLEELADRGIAAELSRCLEVSITPEADVMPMVRAKLMRAGRGGDAREDLDHVIDGAHPPGRLDGRASAPATDRQETYLSPRNDWIEVRVLCWLALPLPPDRRAQFVAEVRGDLAQCPSWWRRAGFVIGLAPYMPQLAWIVRRLGHRRRA